MGRNQTRVGSLAGVHVPGLRKDGPRWSDPYVYLALAEEFGVPPGLLLGADDLQKETAPGERALLRFIERAGIEPEDAIVRLAGLAG